MSRHVATVEGTRLNKLNLIFTIQMQCSKSKIQFILSHLSGNATAEYTVKKIVELL